MLGRSGIKELKVDLFDWLLTVGVFLVGVCLLSKIVEYANRVLVLFT